MSLSPSSAVSPSPTPSPALSLSPAPIVASPPQLVRSEKTSLLFAEACQKRRIQQWGWIYDNADTLRTLQNDDGLTFWQWGLRREDGKKDFLLLLHLLKIRSVEQLAQKLSTFPKNSSSEEQAVCIDCAKKIISHYFEHNNQPSPSWIRAVSLLALSNNDDISILLLQGFTKQVADSLFSDLHTLKALRFALDNTSSEALKSESGNLIRILETLFAELEKIQDNEVLCELLKILGDILDRMEELGTQLPRDKLHLPLYQKFEALKKEGRTPFIFDAAYALQSLVRVSDDKTPIDDALERAKLALKSVWCAIKAVHKIDLEAAVQSFIAAKATISTNQRPKMWHTHAQFLRNLIRNEITADNFAQLKEFLNSQEDLIGNRYIAGCVLNALYDAILEQKNSPQFWEQAVDFLKEMSMNKKWGSDKSVSKAIIETFREVTMLAEPIDFQKVVWEKLVKLASDSHGPLREHVREVLREQMAPNEIETLLVEAPPRESQTMTLFEAAFSSDELHHNISAVQTEVHGLEQVQKRTEVAIRIGFDALHDDQKETQQQLGGMRAGIDGLEKLQKKTGVATRKGFEALHDDLKETQHQLEAGLRDMKAMFQQAFLSPAAASSSQPVSGVSRSADPSVNSLTNASPKIPFGTFAADILKSSEYTKALTPVLTNPKKTFPESLKSMLEALHTVFSMTFESRDDRAGQFAYTEVIGKTGLGKSLLIGYMIGENIARVKDNKGIVSLGYRTGEGNQRTRPTISAALKSETVGAAIYQGYIDTAGLLDTQGWERDICNAVAISTITSEYSPKRLIVLIAPGIFDGKAQEFINLIEMLKRCVRNLTEESVFSSLLFLVSDKKNRCSRADIIEDIDNIVKLLKEERDKILTPQQQGIFQSLFSQQKPSVEVEKQFGEITPELAKEFRDLQDKITILELLLKLKNVHVADFSNQNMRKQIEKWQREGSTGKLTRSDFTMEHLVQGGSHVFETVFTIVISYFNGLLKEFQQIKRKISENSSTIQTLQIEIANREKASTDRLELSQLIEANRRSKEDLEKNLPNLKSDLKILIDIKLKFISEWKLLQKATDPTHLKDLQPTIPITPRRFFAIFDWLATSYTFTYEGVPIADASLVFPVKGDKITKLGTFKEHSKKIDLAQGKYEASYTPAWWGYQQSSKATVKISVQKKDHPKTHAHIAELKKASSIPEELHRGLENLASEDDLRKYLIRHDPWIARLQKDVTRYEETLKDLKRVLDQNISDREPIDEKRTLSDDEKELEVRDREDWAMTRQRRVTARFLNDKREELETLKSDQEILAARYEEVFRKLDDSKPFCVLLSQIISQRGLLKSDALFTQFYENVRSLADDEQSQQIPAALPLPRPMDARV